MDPKRTRFRAYQLKQTGSLMSYATNENFTLIEARIGPWSRPGLEEELHTFDKTRIDTLHITSWDRDHCKKSDLEEILSDFRPSRIEYPGYEPHSDNGQECLDLIMSYKTSQKRKIKVDPPYIKSLDHSEKLGYKNIFYHPTWLSESSNDNSTVKMFRTGSFNVLSLGDVEREDIASSLRRSKFICQEVDVLILAHHGSECALNTKKFFSHVKPKITICTSDYQNQYEHPRPSVKQTLYDLEIPVYTTKTGDIIIESIKGHREHYRLTNFITNGEKISSSRDFISKKSHFLKMNLDARRNRYLK